MFEVTGTWRAVVAPATSGSTNVPVITVVSGTVDLIPRLPAGFLAYVDDYDLGAGVISVTRLPYRPQGTRATRPKAGWAYT